ncbi:MAG TPA: hypothetical protein VGC41_25330, partial [Kofleriaceae bacterium]
MGTVAKWQLPPFRVDSARMRQARRHIPGVVHHLIWRFTDSRYFLDAPGARDIYQRWLGRALLESDWKCLAYALMSSHIHIAVIAGQEPLARWSRRANLPFALWVNDEHGRIGPVFANRANDWAVAPERVPSLIAYIHNNPVRAGVVTSAEASTWTSHGHYVGAQEVTPDWLHVEDGLALSKRTRAEFDAFV